MGSSAVVPGARPPDHGLFADRTFRPREKGTAGKSDSEIDCETARSYPGAGCAGLVVATGRDRHSESKQSRSRPRESLRVGVETNEAGFHRSRRTFSAA